MEFVLIIISVFRQHCWKSMGFRNGSMRMWLNCVPVSEHNDTSPDPARRRRRNDSPITGPLGSGNQKIIVPIKLVTGSPG